ncbi:MAG: radical SAM protein [Lachnospiraceae bacterium]|nr:radical SAM protein [Lachnospiraceae bacterium]MEE3461067.1 radical SAM protein [Lachnospiraceae bacterium]
MDDKDKDAILSLSYGQKVDIGTISRIFRNRNEDDGFLFRTASDMRKRSLNDNITVSGMIAFTNYCSEDCLICGLNRDSKVIKRYRMTDDEIIDRAGRIAGTGLHSIILTGGNDRIYDPEGLKMLLSDLHGKYPDIDYTLELGQRPSSFYKALLNENSRMDYGLVRYLMNEVTASDKLFRRVFPSDQTLLVRSTAAWNIKATGIRNGAGFLVGLPSQNVEELMDEITYLKKLKPDTITVGVFNPESTTRFAHEMSGNAYAALYLIGILRLLFPKTHIIADRSFETVENGYMLQSVEAGADEIVYDFTPRNYADNYRPYDIPEHMGIKSGGLSSVITSLRAAGLNVT